MITLRLGNQQIFHGDIKPANMLTRPGRCDLADLGAAQSLAQVRKWIESYVDGRDNARARDRIVDNLWEGFTPAFIDEKDRRLTVSMLRDYHRKLAENPADREKILKNATDDLFLLMRGRDAYALGQSLKEMTLAREFRLKFINDPTANFDKLPRERHTFFHMEGFNLERAEKIHACLNGMTCKKPVKNLEEARALYQERLRALQELHDLMG